MSRALRSMPWLFASAAVVIVVSALATGSIPDPTWRVTIVTAGVVAATIGWRVHRLPLLFTGAVAVASGRLAGLHLEGYETPGLQLRWHHSLADLLVGAALTGMLGLVLWRRHGGIRLRDNIDMLIVGIGATMVSWLLVAHPLIEEFGVSPGLAVLSAAYLPTTALLVTFTIDLLFTGLTDNRAMQLVAVAALANLTAVLVANLQLVGHGAPEGRVLTVATYAAAFLCMCAGLAHRDVPTTLDPLVGHEHRRTDTPARLVVMAVSVLVPVALITSISPTSDIDVAVRTLGTLTLVVTVVVRLRIAMRDHAEVHDALVRQLNRDDLTGLPTRTRFIECVSDVLETTWRTEHRPTIIQLNLDRFKNINDSLGHGDANRVLVLVSERLADLATSFDGLAARIGGDDFVVVDGSTTDTSDAMERAATVRDALAAPFIVAGSTVFVTASIGVATAPRRSIAAEELLRRADIATHRAKADGRNRVALFDDSMQAHLARRMDVEHALHGAIGRQELRLYYQPVVDVSTGGVNGFEALIRWQRSDGTLVPPSDFIAIAEETGIICELGAWALEEALAQLRRWIDDSLVPVGTTISVNVSPRQIADPGFADIVRHALDDGGISPNLLWLEMTESMMLGEPELAQSTLRHVRSMGVRLALDDFGTGFSSLSLLQQFPIQRIKIDRAFVQGIADLDSDRSLVRTIVAMAQSMGLDVVAEGVETVHQLQELRDLGCGKAQGFLISRPVPPDAMRSTMVALDEFTSLSMFAPTFDDPLLAHRHGDDQRDHRDRSDRPTASSRAAPATPLPVAGGPMGSLASRPLGRPPR